MILVPVSIGELVDKITILQLKEEFIKDETKLANIRNELNHLYRIMENMVLEVDEELDELREMNRIIWNNEDAARKYPENFWTVNQAEEIAEIAMATYRANTRRAQIKYAINKKYNSNIIEEKSYT